MSQTRVCGPPHPGRLIHRLIHMDRSGADQKLVRQGTLSRGPVEGAGRGVFPRPTAEPERAATGVHPAGAVEGSEPAGVGQASGGQSLYNPTGGRVGAGWNLQPRHGAWLLVSLPQTGEGSAAAKLFSRLILAYGGLSGVIGQRADQPRSTSILAFSLKRVRYCQLRKPGVKWPSLHHVNRKG